VRRRSLIWWTLGIVGLIGLTIAFYPSVRDTEGLSDYSRDLPEAARALFVGGELDITSPAGYLDSQVFAFMAPLLLLIFAIGFGAASIAGEEDQGTIDLLLAQPLARSRLALEKVGALTALVLILSLVLLVSVLVSDEIFGLDADIEGVVAASGGAGLLALCFGTLALAIGCVLRGRGRAIAVSASLALAAWMLDGLGQVVNPLDPWRPLSPFYHALGRDPLRDGIPLASWLLLLALTAVLAGLSALALSRRDIGT